MAESLRSTAIESPVDDTTGKFKERLMLENMVLARMQEKLGTDNVRAAHTRTLTRAEPYIELGPIEREASTKLAEKLTTLIGADNIIEGPMNDKWEEASKRSILLRTNGLPAEKLSSVIATVEASQALGGAQRNR
jgi:hypothetical protein